MQFVYSFYFFYNKLWDSFFFSNWWLINSLIGVANFDIDAIGTRFRPLSLNVPKPLFPLGGQPMVHHPISACKRVRIFLDPSLTNCCFQIRGVLDNWHLLVLLKIPNLAQIYLVGFYEEREFALYVSSISNELKIPVR